MKKIGGPVVIGGDNLSSPVRIGLTDVQNIGGGGQWPSWPSVSGTTAVIDSQGGGNT